MIFNKLKKLALVTFVSLSAIPTMGQDILARQAPIDKKMKAVDSVVLKRLVQIEQLENPAADLYEDWNNKYAHKATAVIARRLRNLCWISWRLEESIRILPCSTRDF